MSLHACVCVCFYQKDEVGPLVVEGDGRSAEGGGRVVGALWGRMPESLTGQLGVVQLLLKLWKHRRAKITKRYKCMHKLAFCCMHATKLNLICMVESGDQGRLLLCINLQSPSRDSWFNLCYKWLLQFVFNPPKGSIPSSSFIYSFIKTLSLCYTHSLALYLQISDWFSLSGSSLRPL